MANLEDLVPKQPKSSKAVVELIRGKLDIAFTEKITYIEIKTVIDGKTDTISISGQ